MNVKVLVIDDEPGNCRLVKAIFGAEGFDIVSATDGASGLASVVRVVGDRMPQVYSTGLA